MEKKALCQRGSLGGGNPFIEVCIDTEDHIWLMLHFSSGNIGNMLAQNHTRTVKELAKIEMKLPDLDLAYFAAETPEFAAARYDGGYYGHCFL